jgi:hypothetical protein
MTSGSFKTGAGISPRLRGMGTRPRIRPCLPPGGWHADRRKALALLAATSAIGGAGLAAGGTAGALVGAQLAGTDAAAGLPLGLVVLARPARLCWPRGRQAAWAADGPWQRATSRGPPALCSWSWRQSRPACSPVACWSAGPGHRD